MKHFFTFLIGFLLAFLAFSPAVVQASILDWQVFESDHFVIFYHKGFEYQAKEVAYYLESYYTKIRVLTGNERNFKTRIVLQDAGIDSNGYADNVGRKIGLFTNPPSTGGNLSGYQNWFRLVGGHEFTHMSHLTNYSGAGSLMPIIFGEQMSANMLVPGWIIEGITLYSESQMSPYEGRLQDGYEDAMIASKAAEGKLPSMLEATYFHAYYPMGQHYGIGGVFMRYLANTYGEKKLTEFFDVHGANPVGFLGVFTPIVGVDLAAKKVFGKTFRELYAEWQAAEIAEHKDWKTDGEMLEKARLGYIKYLESSNGKLYYIKTDLLTWAAYSYSGQAKLIEYDPVQKTERVLKTLPADSPTYMQIDGNTIYYSCLNLQRGYANIDEQGYGAFAELYTFDILTGKSQKIFSDAFKAFALLDNGDILYTTDRQDAHGSILWKYSGGEKVELGKIDQLVAQIECYEDRYIIVSKRNGGSWNVSYLFSDLTLEPILDTPWIEAGISLEGDQLYYTANYDSVYRIFRYNLKTQAVEKLTEGGYAYDGRLIHDELYFKGVTPDGQGIFKKALTPVLCELVDSEIPAEERVEEFAQVLEQKNSFGKNLSYLLYPQFRFLPYLWGSEDGLGLTNFYIDYSPHGGLDLSLDTEMLLTPLRIGVSSVRNNRGGRDQILQLSYPVFRKRQFGLSYINLGFGANLTKPFLAGGIYMGLRAPRQVADLALEGQFAGLGLNGSLTYRFLMDQGNLLLSGSIFHQYNKNSVVRGIGVVSGAKADGFTVNAELTHKLVSVNKGFWESTFYLADVYGTLFVDYSSLSGGKISYGAELSGEVGLGFWLQLIPAVGVAVAENDVTPYIGFGAGF